MTMSGWKPTISLIHPSIHPATERLIEGGADTTGLWASWKMGHATSTTNHWPSVGQEHRKQRCQTCFWSPSRDYKRERSTCNERQSKRREDPAQCYHCKGYRHFARKCLSNGLYRLRRNGLPVRVRDPSRVSSQESCQAKEKTSPSKNLN